jgi:hypothetical protein
VGQTVGLAIGVLIAVGLLVAGAWHFSRKKLLSNSQGGMKSAAVPLLPVAANVQSGALANRASYSEAHSQRTLAPPSLGCYPDQYHGGTYSHPIVTSSIAATDTMRDTDTLTFAATDTSRSTFDEAHGHELRARISQDLKSAGGFTQVSNEMSNPSDIIEQPLEAMGLRLGKKIGEGGHADVYEGLFHNDPAAVKILKQLGAAELSAVQSEIEVMKKLRHPHVIQVVIHLSYTRMLWVKFASYTSHILACAHHMNAV